MGALGALIAVILLIGSAISSADTTHKSKKECKGKGLSGYFDGCGKYHKF